MAVKFDFKDLDEPVEIEWPVKVNKPAAGGKFEEATFTARFRIYPVEDIQAMEAEAQKPGADRWLVLKTVLVGLGAIEGELTEALKATLIRRDDTRTALIKAYGELIQGAMAKN